MLKQRARSSTEAAPSLPERVGVAPAASRGKRWMVRSRGPVAMPIEAVMGDSATPTVDTSEDTAPDEAVDERRAVERDAEQEQKGLYPPRHPGRSQRMIG